MPDEPGIGVGTLEAVAQAVRLPVGLVLDKVTLSGSRWAFTVDPFAAVAGEPARVEVEIGEASLQQFLNQTAPGGLEAFRVQLHGGKAIVDAVKRMFVPVPARAICSVRIVEGTQLYVDVEDAAMLGGTVKGLVQSQMEQLNPILNIADLPWTVRLTDAVIDGGKLILRGTAVPTERSAGG
jgi:hypothetical protein